MYFKNRWRLHFLVLNCYSIEIRYWKCVIQIILYTIVLCYFWMKLIHFNHLKYLFMKFNMIKTSINFTINDKSLFISNKKNWWFFHELKYLKVLFTRYNENQNYYLILITECCVTKIGIQSSASRDNECNEGVYNFVSVRCLFY